MIGSLSETVALEKHSEALNLSPFGSDDKTYVLLCDFMTNQHKVAQN